MTWFLLGASVLAILIPTIIYIQILRWLDYCDRAPQSLAIVAFVWGALPAIVLALIFSPLVEYPIRSLLNASLDDAIGATIIAPIVEESAKGLIVYWIFAMTDRAQDDPMLGLIYGALAGYGFELTEDVMYFLGAWAGGGWTAWTGSVVVRALMFGTTHAFFTGMTGLGAGLARASASGFARGAFPLMGLGAAMTFHSLHNIAAVASRDNPATIIFAAVGDWGGLWVMGILVVVARVYEKQWMLQELNEEVDAGLLDRADVQLAASMRARVRTRVIGMLTLDRRAVRRVTWLAPRVMELAHLKHQTRRGRADYRSEIHAVRQEIVAIYNALSNPSF